MSLHSTYFTIDLMELCSCCRTAIREIHTIVVILVSPTLLPSFSLSFHPSIIQPQNHIIPWLHRVRQYQFDVRQYFIALISKAWKIVKQIHGAVNK